MVLAANSSDLARAPHGIGEAGRHPPGTVSADQAAAPPLRSTTTASLAASGPPFFDADILFVTLAVAGLRSAEFVASI
jgi:hypothetical protein